MNGKTAAIIVFALICLSGILGFGMAFLAFLQDIGSAE